MGTLSFYSSVWKYIPYRLRYAICIGVIIGFIISVGLLRFQPQQKLSTNTLSSNEVPDTNTMTGINLTLPFMYYGQVLQVNISFIVLGTSNYTLSLGLYEIIDQNSSMIKTIAPVGTLDTWNATNTTILENTFVLTYYFPHNDYYLLMINVSNGTAPVLWNVNLHIFGTNANYNSIVWILFFTSGVSGGVILISLGYDLYIIVQKRKQIKKEHMNAFITDTTNKKDFNAVIMDFKNDVTTTNNDKHTNSVFFSMVQSFKVNLSPIIKKPNIFILLSAFMVISFITSYLIPTFLFTTPLYKPTRDATINLLLSAPTIRLFILILVLVQIFVSQELWMDKESGFMETVLSFPISSQYYFVGKLILQQIFTLLIAVAYFLPMIIVYFLMPALGPLHLVDLMFFILALYFLIYVITGIQCVLNIFFTTDSAILVEMVVFFGWTILSIGLSPNPGMLLLAPAGLNPFSLDSIEFLTEYFFNANGFHIHSMIPSFPLVFMTIIFQSLLVLVPFIILLFMAKYIDPFKK